MEGKLSVEMTGEQATTGCAPLEFRLFGTFEARVGGRPLPPLRSRREQWLLALLVLRHDRELSRDALAALLWPENPESQARFYLRKSLSNLRRALGEEAGRLLSPTPRAVRLEMAGAFADALAFDAAVARAAASDAPEEAHRQVVALYGGPLLPDCYEEWAAPERTSRAQSYLASLEWLANGALAAGEPVEAVRTLRRLIAADPYRESAACALMQALADCGDRAAVEQVYRELRDRLHRDLNADPAPETEALYRRLRHREAPAALPRPTPPPAAAGRHLPVPLSELIGREAEIDDVVGWLGRCRLVTLVGTGGIGKTRLAVAAADAALPGFPDGAWFVDLAAVSNPALAASAAAKALGVRPEAGEAPQEAVAAALGARALLLVLDNCEHLLDGCAALAHFLLERGAGLRILATSRQPLGVTGEHVYRVPPLGLPPDGGADAPPALAGQEKDPSALLEHAALRLFAERAAQASPAFRWSRRNAEAALDICRRLDGIPLALEMAAARVRSLSTGEIQARLEDRFRLLTTGSRAAQPRQRTLRALLDWSYDLLARDEQTLFRRLSVFAGGFGLEAAEAVVSGRVEGWKSGGPGPASSTLPPFHSPIPSPDVLDLLTALVDRSLVIYEEGEGSPRYRLLETVRQYAWERLAAGDGEADGGEAREAQRRHRDHFLRLAETVPDAQNAADRTAWLNRLEYELGNLRAALDFCEADAASREIGLRFVAALRPFWSMRGHLSEARQRAASLLSLAGAVPPRVRAGALHAAGRLAHTQSDYPGARRLVEEALVLYRSEGDAAGIAGALDTLGRLGTDAAACRRCFEESLAIYRRMGNRHGVALILDQIGIQARQAGEHERARQLFEECLAFHREVSNRAGIAGALHSISYTAFLQGDLPAARALDEESLRLHREVGDRRWELINLQHLGWVCLRLGRLEEARAYCAESLWLQRGLWVRQELATALQCLGDIGFAQRQWERAACLYGAADALIRTHGLVSAEGRPAGTEENDGALRAALGEAAFERARAKGQAMPMDQAVAYALEEG